jgi:hypothetical protein
MTSSKTPASKPPMKALPPTAKMTLEITPAVHPSRLRVLLDQWTRGMLQAAQDGSESPAPNWSGGYSAGLQRAIDDLTQVPGVAE